MLSTLFYSKNHVFMVNTFHFTEHYAFAMPFNFPGSRPSIIVHSLFPLFIPPYCLDTVSKVQTIVAKIQKYILVMHVYYDICSTNYVMDLH